MTWSHLTWISRPASSYLVHASSTLEIEYVHCMHIAAHDYYNHLCQCFFYSVALLLLWYLCLLLYLVYVEFMCSQCAHLLLGQLADLSWRDGRLLGSTFFFSFLFPSSFFSFLLLSSFPFFFSLSKFFLPFLKKYKVSIASRVP